MELRERRKIGNSVAAATIALAAMMPAAASAQSPGIVELSPGTNTLAYVQDISADGSTAVGMTKVITGGSRATAARWNAAGQRTDLPHLEVSPSGDRSASVNATSTSGAVIAGNSARYNVGTPHPDHYATYWDAAGAIHELDSFERGPNGALFATASYISGDGSKIAGFSSRASGSGVDLGNDVIVWELDGSAVAMTNLGGVDASGRRHSAHNTISFDGSTVGGYWQKHDSTGAWLGFRPVKWNSNGTPSELPTLSQLSGFDRAEVYALSENGEIAFGVSDKHDAGGVLLRRVPVWWDASNGVHEIVLPAQIGHARGCSDSGEEAFGTYVDTNGVARGFYWTVEEGAVDLGALNGTGLCAPKDLSEDGRTVVGTSTAADAYGGAFIWRGGQMHSLRNLLVDVYQVDPANSGWLSLDEALFCSADGSVIVGKGTKAGGATGYFRVQLPPNVPPTIVSDLVEADETVQVPLGSTFTASFTGDDEDGDDLTLEATGLPTSAVLTPTAGTVSASPATADLSFAPIANDVGTHEVAISYRDEAGVAATIDFTLVVPVNAVPTLTAPTAVTVECQGEQNLVTLSTTVDDADAGHLLTVTWKVDGVVEQTDDDVAPGSTVEFEYDYPHGETVVRLEVSDSYDTATANSAVTVEDTIAPLIVLAGDIVVPTDPGEDFATNVVLPTPEVHDICDEEPTLTNDAPTTYPLGDTIVTWTAVDEFGNTATVTQLVTVEDVEAPQLVGGGDLTVSVDQGEIFATLVLPEPEAIDNVDDDVAIVSDAPATYPLGETVVTWTATDDDGNQATWSLAVTVVNQAPVADAGGNATLLSTKSAGIEVALDGSESSDADLHDLTFAWSAVGIVFDDATSATPTALFPNGETTVTLTVTDEAGAQSTTTIVVTLDYQPLRVVDTRPLGDETSFYVDETARLVTELHVALGGPTTYDWGWALHYCYWSKYYDDLAESVTYEGPEDYATQLALYKEYRNPQVGCSQLLERHFARTSPGGQAAAWSWARQNAIWGRDYGWTDYYQP